MNYPTHEQANAVLVCDALTTFIAKVGYLPAVSLRLVLSHMDAQESRIDTEDMPLWQAARARVELAIQEAVGVVP